MLLSQTPPNSNSKTLKHLHPCGSDNAQSNYADLGLVIFKIHEMGRLCQAKGEIAEIMALSQAKLPVQHLT